MELLGSSGRGGRRSFSERKLISDLGGHGTPQKELLHFESSQFDQGRLTNYLCTFSAQKRVKSNDLILSQ